MATFLSIQIKSAMVEMSGVDPSRCRGYQMHVEGVGPTLGNIISLA